MAKIRKPAADENPDDTESGAYVSPKDRDDPVSQADIDAKKAQDERAADEVVADRVRFDRQVIQPSEPPEVHKDENWLDNLTGGQSLRDAAVRSVEGYQTEPEGGYPDRNPKGGSYSPINSKELGDLIVDAIFTEIKDKGYTANWPRCMSAIGYAQGQLRRRWGELTGARTRYGKRFADLEARKRGSAEAKEGPAPDPTSAEFRGGETKLPPPEQPAPSQMGDPAAGTEVPEGGYKQEI